LKKPSKIRTNILSLYFTSVSLIGLFLLATLTFGVPTSRVNFSWQKPVIGSIFGVICLLGITAGVYPSKCSKTSHFRKEVESRRNHDAEKECMKEGIVTFEGHHPSCGKFAAHVLRLGDKKYCAGCTGLVVGATVSLLGTLAYLFTGAFPKEVAVLVFWLGFAGVALGLLQYSVFNVGGSFVHMFLNVVYVTGAFLLLIGIEEITSNPLLEVYFVALTLYWILTRILLSQQEHRKICAVCGLESCGFLE